MKVRMGFVSNSSSSSFVCDVCGSSYEGWDGMYDVDHFYCQVGHELCGHCSGSVHIAIKALAKDMNRAAEQLEMTDAEFNELMGVEDKEDWIKERVMYDELDSAVCPICNFTHISGSLEAQFLREKFGLKRDEVIQELRTTYKNLKGWEKRNEG